MQGYLTSPAYGHNLVSSVIIHNIDDIMKIPETGEQAGAYFGEIVTHMTNRGWLVNPGKV